MTTTDLWSIGWVRWLAGFLFGAILGLGYWVVGILAVLIAGVALVLAIVGRWQLWFVSGWVTGIGAMTAGIMIRAVWLCAESNTRPGEYCKPETGIYTLLWIGLAIVAGGVVIGILAWRRMRLSWEPPA